MTDDSILVSCNHCPLLKRVETVEDGVAYLAQHTIAVHPEVAESSPIVHVWRQYVRGQAQFNGHNKVNSEGIFYSD